MDGTKAVSHVKMVKHLTSASGTFHKAFLLRILKYISSRLREGFERANLGAFRTFVRFALVWFCLFFLVSGRGCG